MKIRTALTFCLLTLLAICPSAFGKTIVHQVKKGDTLSQIAVWYLHNRYAYAQIVKENKIHNPEIIRLGQNLKITVADDVIQKSKFSFKTPKIESAPLLQVELDLKSRMETSVLSAPKPNIPPLLAPANFQNPKKIDGKEASAKVEPKLEAKAATTLNGKPAVYFYLPENVASIQSPDLPGMLLDKPKGDQWGERHQVKVLVSGRTCYIPMPKKGLTKTSRLAVNLPDRILFVERDALLVGNLDNQRHKTLAKNNLNSKSFEVLRGFFPKKSTTSATVFKTVLPYVARGLPMALMFSPHVAALGAGQSVAMDLIYRKIRRGQHDGMSAAMEQLKAKVAEQDQQLQDLRQQLSELQLFKEQLLGTTFEPNQN